VRDAVLTSSLTALNPHELYGNGEVYAAAKRQLSAKEARDLGLR
jgi:hypothetical protein